MKKSARKPSRPRKDYEVLWRQADWRRRELEKELEQKIAAAKQEIEAATKRYEEAFPQTVALYQEVRALKESLRVYKARLAGLLDEEQLEAAKISHCAPDEYAIQLIRLCKRKIEEISSLTGRNYS